jgi:hypothetical protein
VASCQAPTGKAPVQSSDIKGNVKPVGNLWPKFYLGASNSGQLPTAPGGISGESFNYVKSGDGQLIESGNGSFATEWGIDYLKVNTFEAKRANWYHNPNNFFNADEDLPLFCEIVAKIKSDLEDHAQGATGEKLNAAKVWKQVLTSVERKKCVPAN